MAENYKNHSIAHQMVTEVMKISHDSKIKDIFKLLSKGTKKYKMEDYIYVIDNKNNLIGVISLEEIFNHPKSTPVNKIMKTQLATISLGADEEKAADLALKHGIRAVPIVKNGKLLGAIPTKKLLAILNRSLQQDILHFAGIHKSHLNYEDTTKVPLLLSVVHRVPWLFIGLIGISIAAIFISIFDSILEKHIILASFIPAIVYMSSALGTQHQTLFIRDLAVLGKKLNLFNYFLRQTFIAAVIGLFVSSLTFLGIYIWKEFFIAFVIAFSMFVSLIVTNFTSLTTTLILFKLGKDPALGSGPFATVISDVSSIIIYFLIASLLLI
jgi:magnesium transporter